MKRYMVWCRNTREGTEEVTAGPFTVFSLPIMRLAVWSSHRMTRTIPDWPYRYEIREVRPKEYGDYNCAAHPEFLIKDCPHDHVRWEH